MQDADADKRGFAGETQALYSQKPKLEQVSHNLPGHKNVDEELDKVWREWKSIFDAIKDSIILVDSEFKIIQANLASSQLFGRPLDQIIGKTCWQLVHGTNEAPEECPLKRAKTTKKHEQIELYLPEKGIWIEALVSPVFDQQGNLSGAVHIIRDITNRKQVEELLRKEKDKAQKYLDVAAVIMIAIDSEGRVGLINKKGCQILGYNENEILGKNWFDNFLPKRIRNKVRELSDKMLKGEIEVNEYFENPVLTKSGDEKLIGWHSVILRDEKGAIIGHLSSGEDITERKRAEEALRESESRLRSFQESATDGLIVFDSRLNLTDINKAALEMLGVNKKDMIGKNILEISPDIKTTGRYDIYLEVLRTGKPYFIDEVVPHPKFRDKHLSLRIFKVGDGLGIIGTDITERKKAEQALRESEEMFRSIFETSLVGVAICSTDKKWLYVNNQICKILGYSEKELLQTTWDKLTHPDDLEADVSQYNRLLAGEIENYKLEKRFIRKDSSVVYARIYISCKKNQYDAVEYDIGLLEDITERKKAEEKLLDYQSQLKTLASELTLAEERERRRLAIKLHDRISQALVISKIKLDALRKSGRSRKPNKALEDICNSIVQTIQDTRTLTFDLGSPALYELGFETAVSEWLTDQIQKKHGITVEFEDDGKPKPLDDDVRILLFRDVRELLTNVAKHSGAGKVKVSIRKVGSEIHICVEDDGWGFDTKKAAATAVKEGGFGLFSIRERLGQLGGRLEIESEPGYGTKATLIAPLKQEKVSRKRKK
jgi:PAS domain S-box-containing protein